MDIQTWTNIYGTSTHNHRRFESLINPPPPTKNSSAPVRQESYVSYERERHEIRLRSMRDSAHEDLKKGHVASAAHTLTMLKDEGDAWGIGMLGLLHHHGTAMPQDLPLARKYLTYAARRKIDFAYYKLGLMLVEGEGGPKEEAKGMMWLKKAAHVGFPPALYALGVLREEASHCGDPVPKLLRIKTDAAAYAWIALAAEKGHAEAKSTLTEYEKNRSAQELLEMRARVEDLRKHLKSPFWTSFCFWREKRVSRFY
jgi:hypothetical protein